MSKATVLCMTLLVLMTVSACAVINTKTVVKETEIKYESQTTITFFVIPIVYSEKTINKVDMESEK